MSRDAKHKNEKRRIEQASRKNAFLTKPNQKWMQGIQAKALAIKNFCTIRLE
ncbi:MAG: hypothetical protein QW594_02075 [Candidatus Woesearchaeota archaeon]